MAQYFFISLVTKTSSDQFTEFEFRIFAIMLNKIVNIPTQVNISRFHFYCSICVVVFVNYFIEFIGAHISWHHSQLLLVTFVLQSSDVSATTDFPLLCIKYILMPLSHNQNFTDLLQNSLPLSTHILLGLQPDLCKKF